MGKDGGSDIVVLRVEAVAYILRRPDCIDRPFVGSVAGQCVEFVIYVAQLGDGVVEMQKRYLLFVFRFVEILEHAFDLCGFLLHRNVLYAAIRFQDIIQADACLCICRIRTFTSDGGRVDDE